MLGNELSRSESSVKRSAKQWTVDEISAEEYAGFLELNPHLGTPFNRHDVLSLMGEVFGRKQLTLGFSDSEEQLCGVTSLLIQKKGPLGLIQGLPARNAQYVAADVDVVPQILSALRTNLAKRGIGQSHLSFPPTMQLDEQSVSARGFKLRPNLAKVIDIKGKSRDEIMGQVQARMRTAIRKTEKDGVVVEKASQHDMEVILPDLLDQTYKRQGSYSSYPQQMGALMHERFGQDPNFDMRSAKLNGETVAMMVAAGDDVFNSERDGRIYSWMIARNYDEQIPNLNYTARLVYEIATTAAERGYASFDLGGGVAGIHAFKEKLGGTDHPYLDMQSTHPLYVPVFEGWNLVKKLRSKLG